MKPHRRTTLLHIFVSELSLPASVGVYDHERTQTQRLIFDIEVRMVPPVDDTLAATLDYDGIVDTVQHVLAHGHYQLVETIAKNVCAEIFSDLRVHDIMLQISKPAAVKSARAAGVVWFETRDASVNLESRQPISRPQFASFYQDHRTAKPAR